MRSETSFEIDGDLSLIEAVIVGPGGRGTARLVLDTGSALTTLIPAIAESIGYTPQHRVARSVVVRRWPKSTDTSSAWRTSVLLASHYLVCT